MRYYLSNHQIIVSRYDLKIFEIIKTIVLNILTMVRGLKELIWMSIFLLVQRSRADHGGLKDVIHKSLFRLWNTVSIYV